MFSHFFDALRCPFSAGESAVLPVGVCVGVWRAYRSWAARWPARVVSPSHRSAAAARPPASGVRPSRS
jgi:hypothetical protein